MVNENTKSVSAFDLVFVDSGDSLEVAHSAGAGALAVLGLEGPSVYIT